MFNLMDVFLCCLFLSSLQVIVANTKTLQSQLFPNFTCNTLLDDKNSRILQSGSKNTIPCVKCSGLSYCSILNGYMIQEVYYPENLNLMNLQQIGTCSVIESLGKRLSNEIFGNGRTFRDTSVCRQITLEYLCLFYGSNNAMYKNICIKYEDYSDPNPVSHKVAPRQPCRSFCIQVATLCANDENFMQTCLDIACPLDEGSCTPDPLINGQSLGASLGCNLPFDNNPYVRKSSAPSLRISIYSWSFRLLALMNMIVIFISLR